MANEANTTTAVVPPPPLPTVHEAELAPGLSGIVYWGQEIDIAIAVALRSAGRNVVVRGDDLKANRRLAAQIEGAVGPSKRGTPHKSRAGAHALPHYQQFDHNHPGQCFYETPNRRARRKP
jgi:hypothetical protein